MELEVALNKFIALIDELLQIIPLERQAVRMHLAMVKTEAPAAMRRYGAYGSGYYILRVPTYMMKWSEVESARWVDFMFPILEQMGDLACEVGGLPKVRFTHNKPRVI